MSFKKIFNVSLIISCSTLGVIGAFKKYKHVFITRPSFIHTPSHTPLEIAKSALDTHKNEICEVAINLDYKASLSSVSLPLIDRMGQLFNIGSNKLPIVETVSFSPKVSWLEGKLAWVADYASHYKTSRHFIARSLNGKPDYFSQQVSTGSKFNVFNPSRPFDFHLVVDLSTCQMALYYHDHTTNERVLLKTYRVGVGRKDDNKASGSLTPLGTYKVGSKIAIYKPGTIGTFQDKKVEMIRVFGTRWLPFEQSVSEPSKSMSKGIGIHGLPWQDSEDGQYLEENLTSIGTYSSDGCIRLPKDEVEELFAVVITKDCYVHVVDSILNANLPGNEVVNPTR